MVSSDCLVENMCLHVVGQRSVQSAERAFGKESFLGMYGLTSIMGDRSKASRFLRVRMQFPTFESSTIDRPMRFGRGGLRHAKTPVSTFTVCLSGKTRSVCRSFGVSRR